MSRATAHASVDQILAATALRPLRPTMPLGRPLPRAPAGAARRCGASAGISGSGHARAGVTGRPERAGAPAALRAPRDCQAERALHPQRTAQARDRRRPARAQDGAPGCGALPRRRQLLPRAGQPRRRRERQACGDRAQRHQPAARLGATQPPLPARRVRALREPSAKGGIAVRVQAQRGPVDPREARR